jgi:hypothetical protein
MHGATIKKSVSQLFITSLHALDGYMLRQLNGHIQAIKIHEIKIIIPK